MACIGIDEAGRGPLAGPVTAAAVVLPDSFPRELMRDSKKCSPARRLILEQVIKEQAICWALGWASHRTIDQVNIHQATLVAMERSFHALSCSSKWHIPVLVDGSHIPPLRHPDISAVVRGDASVPEIMAASILAKTARDRWMEHAGARYPYWGFEVHKGYPTKIHRERCIALGISPIHRRSFRIAFSS